MRTVGRMKKRRGSSGPIMLLSSGILGRGCPLFCLLLSFVQSCK